MATPSWLSGSDALALLRSLDDSTDAGEHLVTLCADRIVEAQCGRWIFHDAAHPQNDENDVKLQPIDYTFWTDPNLDPDWPKSVFVLEKYDPFGSTTTRAREVEFRGDQITAYLRGDKAKFEDYWPIPAPDVEVSETRPPLRPLNPYARAQRPVVGGISPPPKRDPSVSPPLPRAPKRKVNPRGRGKDPVTETEIRRWYEGLTPEERALGYRDLWPLARTAFHPRKVVRKLAEALVEKRKRGRKSKA